MAWQPAPSGSSPARATSSCRRSHEAMRLTDEPATCRQLYPRSRLTLPNVMPIDIPARFAGAGLPLGRCYPVILETAGVCRDGNRPRRLPSGPDLFDRRPSAFTPSTSSSSATHPPAALLLCRWLSRLYRHGAASRGRFHPRCLYERGLRRRPRSGPRRSPATRDVRHAPSRVHAPAPQSLRSGLMLPAGTLRPALPADIR